jgi:hypothetical protein
MAANGGIVFLVFPKRSGRGGKSIRNDEVTGSIPVRSANFFLDIPDREVLCRTLRSRLRRAPAALTPAKRLKFDPGQVHQNKSLTCDPCLKSLTVLDFSATYKLPGAALVAGRNYKNRRLWVGLWVGDLVFGRWSTQPCTGSCASAPARFDGYDGRTGTYPVLLP